MKPLGLYLGLPFCIARCAFCAFDVEGFRAGKAERYLEALQKEMTIISRNPDVQCRELTSLYFGGGTPSHYDADTLLELLALCRKLFQISPKAEISLEAHPATVDAEKLRGFRVAGVNRLSFGMQSFSGAQLQALGRHHSVCQADEAFFAARTAGFENIGIDLIYGLPKQTQADWEKTLHHAAALSPEHLSIYALSIEEGTLFGKKMSAGQLDLPSEDETVVFYEFARTYLAHTGYRQYELSNFARPGYACRHNLLYWDREETLACGVSAHAYFNRERRENVASISAYIEMLSRGRLPIAQSEKLSARQAQQDRIIFGLRKSEGIPLGMISSDPGFQQITEEMKCSGLLRLQGNNILLSEKGALLADEVAIAYL